MAQNQRQEHKHTHSHIHSHTHGQTLELRRLSVTFLVVILLNLGFFAAELIVSLRYDSMGLYSDAGHKLFDVLALLAAQFAFLLGSCHPASRFKYLCKRISEIIPLANALLLMAMIIHIIVESFGKLGHPEEVEGGVISLTAAAGIVVSGVSAILLGRFRKSDINSRAAFLHMATDSLMSIGVVVSGLVIRFTGWFVLDPAVGMIIALVMLGNAVLLLIDSVRLNISSIREHRKEQTSNK